jgi:hypothetical protein
MPQLDRTMYTLRNDGLVTRWEKFFEGCATVYLPNEKKVLIFIAEDFYGVTLADIMGAKSTVPELEYIVLNSWQGITEAAEEYCRDNGLNVISYKDLRRLLHNDEIGH